MTGEHRHKREKGDEVRAATANLARLNVARDHLFINELWRITGNDIGNDIDNDRGWTTTRRKPGGATPDLL